MKMTIDKLCLCDDGLKIKITHLSVRSQTCGISMLRVQYSLDVDNENNV